jgi:hypothetical protein
MNEPQKAALGLQETLKPSLSVVPNTHNAPQNGHLRPRLTFDLGNRFLKWIDPNGEIQCIPSCIKECSKHEWKRVKQYPNSVLVEIDEKFFVIGELAQQLNGQPTFTKNKCELAEILVLAAIQPLHRQSVHIERLIVSIPNTLNEEDVNAIQKLANYPLAREFKRNGQYLVYTVAEVEIYDETQPAFKYARDQGFFLYPDTKNGIWDIGGGTSISRIYLPNGQPVFDAEIILPGTKSLAHLIAAELKEEFNLQYSPGLPAIMDSIARGDYLYGADKVDFSAIFQKVCEQWVESARSEIRSKWVAHLHELGEVLIVGGSAGIAAPLCQASGDRFKIAPQPQLFNLIAMANME